MTTVTQADRDRADSFFTGLTLGHTGVRRLERILATHRETAFEEGARGMQEAAINLCLRWALAARQLDRPSRDRANAFNAAAAAIRALDPAQIAGDKP